MRLVWIGRPTAGLQKLARPRLREPSKVTDVPLRQICTRDISMNGIIYLVGLIVIIMFILSFLGLR